MIAAPAPTQDTAPQPVTQQQQQTVPIEEYRRVCAELKQARAELRATNALLKTPNTLLSPSQRITAHALRNTGRSWDAQGKRGPQPLSTPILSEQIALGKAAARANLHRLDELGVIRITKKPSKYEHADYFEVEILPGLYDPPTDWGGEERDPNGKRCACNADTYTEVVRQERRISTTILRTVCTKCGIVHRTRTLDLHRSNPHDISDTRTFDTEEEAISFVKSGRNMPKNGQNVLVQNISEPATNAPAAVAKEPMGSDEPRHNLREEGNTRVRQSTTDEEHREGAAPDRRQSLEESRPAWLAPKPGHMPQPLLRLPQWVIWRAVWRVNEATGKGKWTKPPLNPRTGEPASVADPTTWGTIHEACEGMQLHAADGIGFMFTASDPFAAVDLDTLDDDARGIIADLDSYAEQSPSGRGAHVIVQATKPAGGCKRGPVEIYDQARFLTITGQRIDGTPATIRERQDQLTAVHAGLFPPAAARAVSGSTPALSTTDAVLIERCERDSAAHSIPFAPLFCGDIAGAGGDASRADYWLCRHLAYFGGTADQIDRIYRRSGLAADPARAAKWDRVGAQTIRTALDDAANSRRPDA